MRRAVAAALLGISLWLGSLAWSGFLLTRTVLDPDRSERVAEALYEDEAVRDRLAENIAAGVRSALPPGPPVEQQAIDSGAKRALDSPAVRSLFVDAFVRTHQAMLGEGDVPRQVDPGAFGAAGRESLVGARPELDAILPGAPEVRVTLPTERVPNLGPVRRGLLAGIPVLATTAAAGVVLALLITSNRPAVVRRAGFWAIGLSAVVLAVAHGIPAVAAAVVPSQAEVVAALVSAMVAETRVPAVTLGALGLAGIVLSLFWRAAPALLADPALPGHRAGRQPRPRRRREPRLVSGPPPRRDIARPAPRPVPPRVPRRPDPSLTTVLDRGGNADVTRRQDVPAPPPGPTRWVAGVGWIVESVEQIPPEARWVPGVGYVVEEA